MAATYEVSFTSNLTVNFSAADVEEVLQNVAMIITSVCYSCPMARAFAWDANLLDRPMNVVKSLLASRLINAVSTYESRAEIVSISFSGDADSGMLKPTLKVKVNLDG